MVGFMMRYYTCRCCYMSAKIQMKLFVFLINQQKLKPKKIHRSGIKERTKEVTIWRLWVYTQIFCKALQHLTTSCENLQSSWFFPLFQCPETLRGCHVWGPGSQPGLSHGDFHFLCRLLCGVSLLLRQHIRGFDHHHFSGAGRQSHVGMHVGKERGENGKWCPLMLFFLLLGNKWLSTQHTAQTQWCFRRRRSLYIVILF